MNGDHVVHLLLAERGDALLGEAECVHHDEVCDAEGASRLPLLTAPSPSRVPTTFYRASLPVLDSHVTANALWP